MITKDFRIGNMFMSESGTFYSVYHISVEGDSHMINHRDAKHALPIPITEELLHLLGFPRDEGGHFVISPSHIILFGGYWGMDVVCQYHHLGAPIKNFRCEHIHTLQNIIHTFFEGEELKFPNG